MLRPLAPPQRLAPPERLAVSLEEARSQVLSLDDEDELLLAYLAAAQELVETRVRRTLTTTRWKAAFASLPDAGGALALPMPPLVSVQLVTFTAATGEPAQLDTGADLRLAGLSTPGLLFPVAGVWPSTAADTEVAVQYTAGYGDPSAVPAAAKQAIRLLVGHWYKHREQVVVGAAPQNLPHAVDALLGSLKWGDYS